MMTYEEDKQTIYNIGTKKAEARGEERGLKIGEKRGKSATIISMLENGVSKEVIAKGLNMSLESLDNFLKEKSY